MEVFRQKRKLLVIEDNDLNRGILSAILEREYEIMEAEDGQKGLELLTKHYRELSAILLDVYMPLMDGFEFMEKVKGDVMLSSVPIIVTTGSDKQETEMQCLELGASDFITKPYSPKVVMARLHSIIKLHESVAALSAVEFDDETGLYTRQAFYHHAAQLINMHSDISFHLVTIEIENLKFIKMVHGEKMRKKLIRHVGHAFSEVFSRGIGFHEGSQLTFMIHSDSDMANVQWHEMAKMVTEGAPVDNVMIKYAIYPNIDRNPEIPVLCERLQFALDSIKNNYMVNHVVYDEQLVEKQMKDKAMEEAFDDALEKNEFVVWYQPKYNPLTGEIEAAEALVRWITPDGRRLSPGEFIPLFEKDGLIVKLDEFVFSRVCDFQKERYNAGLKIYPISVNLSRISLFHEDVIERYISITREKGVEVEYLPIELTETMMNSSIRLRELTGKMISRGLHLHMDDFGSGYSSLTSLNQISFEAVKLDKGLVDYIGDKKGEVILRHTIGIAKELGMQVVAEGVEEKAQVDFLAEAGCDLIQGYYYCKPVPEQEFAEMLR